MDMMGDDLHRLWDKLQLTEEEGEAWVVPDDVLPEGPEWVPNCLLGSLLTSREYNKVAFKKTVERIWRATPLMRIIEVGENLYLFHFRSEAERDVVLKGGPWNFDDSLILLKCLEENDKPQRDLLNKASFWIQVFNLPFVAMTDKMGRWIGSKIGRVEDVRTDEEGSGMGRCLAIRVELDVKKPLMRRMKLEVKKGTEIVVDFKYERLPDFCFGCGVMGHREKECVVMMVKRKVDPAMSLQFGAWLRAPSRQKFWGRGKLPGNPAGGSDGRGYSDRDNLRRDLGGIHVAREPSFQKRPDTAELETKTGEEKSLADRTTKVVLNEQSEEKENTKSKDDGLAHTMEEVDPNRGLKDSAMGPRDEIAKDVHLDNLFGDMDILIRTGQPSVDPLQLGQIEALNQMASQNSPELAQAVTANKMGVKFRRMAKQNRGKENSTAGETRSDGGKRRVSEVSGVGEGEVYSTKRQALGEITKVTAAGADVQPRRLQ